MASEKKPDFLVLGAGKAGTTWLWKLLRQHPRCFLPDDKEINYFNRESAEDPAIANHNYGKPIEWYYRRFAGADPDKLWGEISPSYLWSETAPQDIWRFNPDIKLIAILRDPVERTFSHYLYRFQRGATKYRDFETALRHDLFMVERSRYGKHLERYLELFPRHSLKIVFFDDLRNEPTNLADEIFDFLGLEHLEFSMDRVNQTGRAQHPRLVRGIAGIERLLKQVGAFEAAQALVRKSGIVRLVRGVRNQTVPFSDKPKIKTDTEHSLRASFLDDIKKVEQISGRDLAGWKSNRID